MLNLILPTWITSSLKVLSIFALVFFCSFAGYTYRDNQALDEKLKQQDQVITIIKKQTEVSERTVIKYLDRVKTVEIQGDTIVKEIPIYVDTGNLLSYNWGVLHNSAATTKPISKPTSSVDGKALTIDSTTALNAVVTNYSACNRYIVQLEELQDWIIKQKEASQ